uniref:SH3 domain-binding glutamic acid-rich-like protein 3 n=2 Tax=Carnivora TaxID=33554 RepID=A0A452U902_URSMA
RCRDVGLGLPGRVPRWAPRLEPLLWASWILGSPSTSCPRPSRRSDTHSLQPHYHPDHVLIVPFLSSTLCVPGRGWPLTSLHPSLPCLPLAELLVLSRSPTPNFIPLPFFLLTPLGMVVPLSSCTTASLTQPPNSLVARTLAQIKSQQSEVTRILDGKRIQYQLVDISQDNALRDEMRALAGNPKATPPQIVNGDQYCGDYELFVEAVEQNTLQEFLKLA